MKKQISTILAGSLLLASLVPSMAFADALTLDQKFEALKANGVVTSTNYDATMTRAEFAVVIARLWKLDTGVSVTGFSDVPEKHWAAGAISAVSRQGIMKGAYGKFNPKAAVSVQELAKVLTSTLQTAELPNEAVAGSVSDWAKGAVAAAVKAGYITPVADYKAGAKRSALIEAAYTAWTVINATPAPTATPEVTATPAPTAAPTAAPSVAASATAAPTAAPSATAAPTAAPITASAKVSNTNQFTVSFSSAVDTTKVTFEVKNGSVLWKPTVAFADDKKSATLTAAFSVDTDYTVTVKGLGADQVSTLKIAAAAATSNVIDGNITNVLSANGGTYNDLALLTKDQYGNTVDNVIGNFTYTVYDAKGTKIEKTATKNANPAYDFTAAKVGDEYTVYAFNTVKSVYSTIKFQVKDIAKLNAFTLVAPTYKKIADNTAVTIFDGATAYAVVGVTATDKDGAALTVSKANNVNYFTLADTKVQVYSSDSAVVNAVSGIVSSTDGKSLEIRTVGGASGSTKLTFVYNDKVATLDLKAEAPSKLNSITLTPPTAVYAGQAAKFTYVAQDQFGTAIAAADVNGKNAAKYADFGKFIVRYADADGGNVLSITQATGVEIFTAADGTLAVPASFLTKAGTVTVTPYINGVYASTITLKVNAAAIPQTISKIDLGTKNFLAGGTTTLKAEQITVLDQYGNSINLKDSAYRAKVEVIDADDVAGTAYIGNAITVDNAATATVLANNTAVTLKGANAGKSSLKVTIQKLDGANWVDITLAGNAKLSESFDVNTLTADKVASYTTNAITTLYAGKVKDNLGADVAQTATSVYAQAITVSGKTAAGEIVAIPANQQFVVVSDKPGVVGTLTTNATAGDLTTDRVLKVYGLSAGTAKITVKLNGVDVASTNITTTVEAPKLTTLKFADVDALAPWTTRQGAVNSTYDVKAQLTAQDQYVIDYPKSGIFSVSDTTIATINPITGVLTLKADGKVTVAFVADTGETKSIEITVDVP